MEPRYARNIPALTEAECALLRTKKVAVIGCGGLGGHIIDQLCRIGIGSIRAVDGDFFEESNLNRQLLSQVPLLGSAKASAAYMHAACVNPQVQIDAISEYLTEANADRLLLSCDLVMDALDNIPSRKILSSACIKAGIPYVYGAISGWVAQAGISMPGDGLIETLYPEDTVLADKSVLSFTPALCASLQVSLAIQLLTGRSVSTGTVFYFDLLNQDFEVIPLV